jgi:pimeloyl-ACP methyl ester carboxylesterase
MSTFVLVHGGAHGGWCWGKLAPLLRAAGQEVYTPTMTGVGERSHLLSDTIDLDVHIQDVVSVLDFEDLSEIILVGHSYGGLVITGVADRAIARVAHLVYLDAVIPVNGESLMTIMPETLASARSAGHVSNGVELVLWPEEEAGRFYGVTDPNDLAWMQTRLTPHPWKTFEQPLELQHEQDLARIPRAVVNATRNEHRASLVEQKIRHDRADRIWDLDTGHDLMITEPESVAELLLRLADPRA